MDIQHVGGGEQAILLGCEVEKEGCWCLWSELALLQEIGIA